MFLHTEKTRTQQYQVETWSCYAGSLCSANVSNTKMILIFSGDCIHIDTRNSMDSTLLLYLEKKERSFSTSGPQSILQEIELSNGIPEHYPCHRYEKVHSCISGLMHHSSNKQQY